MKVIPGSLLLLIGLLLAFETWPQGKPLKGEISENNQNIPVSRASVFINNTTYGAICDEQGRFVLHSYPAPPFQLTVTAVGYEPGTVDITADMIGKPVIIRLNPKVFNLDEVQVLHPEKNGWQKFGKIFTEAFIGYSSYAKECTILNKETLQFFWNNEERILRITAGEPLRIRNRATGYLVTYWLDDFELNFATQKLYFRGYSHFEELHSKKARQTEMWRSKRKSAYNGSLCHFMRCLYQGDALSEGFEIRALRRMEASEAGKYRPIWSDTLSLSDKDKMAKLATAMYGEPDMSILLPLFAKIKSWQDDSTRQPLRIAGRPGPDSAVIREFRFVKMKSQPESLIVRYFETRMEDTALVPDGVVREDLKLSPGIKILPAGADSPLVLSHAGGTLSVPENLLPILHSKRKIVDVLFTDIVLLDSIIQRNGDQVVLRFPPYLHVTYTRETGDPEYYRRITPFSATPGSEESIISIRDNKTLVLTPEGNFYDSYDLMVEQYWAYEKLDKLLPLDFKP